MKFTVPADLSIPAFLKIPKPERDKGWRDRPPVAMPAFIDPKLQRSRQLEAERTKASLAKLKASVERKKARGDGASLPADFNLRDYRWDPRLVRFVRDELAYLAKPASGLVEKLEPKVVAQLKKTGKAIARNALLEKLVDSQPAPRAPAPDDLPAQIKARYGADAAKLKSFAVANGCWDDKYGKLPNPGLVRMNIVNRLRAKVRKGHVVVWK